mgnify:CR=1 FL=1
MGPRRVILGQNYELRLDAAREELRGGFCLGAPRFWRRFDSRSDRSRDVWKNKPLAYANAVMASSSARTLSRRLPSPIRNPLLDRGVICGLTAGTL